MYTNKLNNSLLIARYSPYFRIPPGGSYEDIAKAEGFNTEEPSTQDKIPETQSVKGQPIKDMGRIVVQAETLHSNE
ncbi:hypothetical protein M1512_00815 [Patescibacteria group bacterium]|nr:hypothetical protein [Patescibacteria group bacterium]